MTAARSQNLKMRYRETLSRAEAVELLAEFGVSRRTLELWVSMPDTEEFIRYQIPGMVTHRYRRDALISLCDG